MTLKFGIIAITQIKNPHVQQPFISGEKMIIHNIPANSRANLETPLALAYRKSLLSLFPSSDSGKISRNTALSNHSNHLLQWPYPTLQTQEDAQPAEPRTLLLQGPMGKFFTRFGNYIKSQGGNVWKINFNGGDWFDSPTLNRINFRGALAEWPLFLARIIRQYRIDQIFVYGDCRAYHREAIRIARMTGVRIFVFEEGYVRPNYITLEEGGVNGFSSLRRDPKFYVTQPVPLRKPPELPSTCSFWRMAAAATTYYLATVCLRPWFPHYQHHKDFSAGREAGMWCLSGLRKLCYAVRDRNLTGQFAGRLSKRYFLVPLQVHSDSQIAFHSSYPCVEAFIDDVLESFARHAPADSVLVFKHHPMDRGARHYGGRIARLRDRHQLGERVLYVHEVHLPTVLNHARGVVVINSTVGFSALLHAAPVKVMGRAIYDIPGLTCQEPLEHFWNHPGAVSKPLFNAFQRHVVATTQINGSFHG